MIHGGGFGRQPSCQLAKKNGRCRKLLQGIRRPSAVIFTYESSAQREIRARFFDRLKSASRGLRVSGLPLAGQVCGGGSRYLKAATSWWEENPVDANSLCVCPPRVLLRAAGWELCDSACSQGSPSQVCSEKSDV